MYLLLEIFQLRSIGISIPTGLVQILPLALSSTQDFQDGWASDDVDTTAVDGAYPIATVDVSGRLARTNKISYSLITSALTVPALTVYGSNGVNVSSDVNVSGGLNVSSNANVSGDSCYRY